MVNIIYKNDSLLFKTNSVLTQMVMATQQRDTIYPNSGYHQLRLRSLYSDGRSSFIFGDFNKRGKVHIEYTSPKVGSESLTAIDVQVTVNGVSDES